MIAVEEVRLKPVHWESTTEDKRFSNASIALATLAERNPLQSRTGCRDGGCELGRVEPRSGHTALDAGVCSNLPLLCRHKAGALQQTAPHLPLHLHDPHLAFLPHGVHDWEYSRSKTLS